MKEDETQRKSTIDFKKSFGSGMKSVFSAKGRTYYILEHKISSGEHKAGDKQEIIVDYIEMGRDPKCQVRFSENLPTVSRRHAAITKEGDNWVLKNLSEVNPTLINGQAVEKQWFLQNGDEIQLSYEGPKMGFLIPSNPSVKSIGLSHRLSLFRQQALRPYKKVVTLLSVLIVFLIIGLTATIIWVNIKTENWETTKKDLISQINNSREISSQEADSLRNVIKANKEETDNTNKILKDQIYSLRKRDKIKVENEKGNYQNIPAQVPQFLTASYPSVFFIYVDSVRIDFEGEKEVLDDYKWSGTGFLLNDSRFVTSRYNIEPWYYLEDTTYSKFSNQCVSNGGSVTAYFTAVSSDGKTTLSFKSSDFIVNRKDDKYKNYDNDTVNLLFEIASKNSRNNWAYLTVKETGTIEYDVTLSDNLPARDTLHILGYNAGWVTSKPTILTPVYGYCTVAQPGLQNGLISVNNFNFPNGSTGCPVFTRKNNRYIAIGIVIRTGSEKTIVLPLSAIQ